MKTFVIHLQSATQYERVDDAVSFVATDGSGSFGILAGHARMMTVLEFGLARFRVRNQPWEYLGLPGALLYFADGELTMSTRHYLRSRDYEGLSVALRERLMAEERELDEVKRSLRRLEEEMFKRLWQASRPGVGRDAVSR